MNKTAYLCVFFSFYKKNNRLLHQVNMTIVPDNLILGISSKNRPFQYFFFVPKVHLESMSYVKEKKACGVNKMHK